MPRHSCFQCGALLDDTCGKDSQGNWVCGACWDKNAAARAKLELAKAAKGSNEDVAWWRLFLEALARAITGRPRRW